MEQKKKKKKIAFVPTRFEHRKTPTIPKNPKKKNLSICFMLWAVCVSLVESSIFLDLRAFFA